MDYRNARRAALQSIVLDFGTPFHKHGLPVPDLRIEAERTALERKIAQMITGSYDRKVEVKIVAWNERISGNRRYREIRLRGPNVRPVTVRAWRHEPVRA